MSQIPGSWLEDPSGKDQLRYWDGSEWTAHVISDGIQSIDPIGAVPSVVVDTPATGRPVGRGLAFLDRLAPDSRERPRPGTSTAVAGLGGVVITGGIIVVIVGDHITTSKLIAVSLVILALAVAIRLFVKVPEVAAAAVGMAVVAIPVFALAATVNSGRGTFLSGALMAAGFLIAWVAPGFRGRNLFLAVGLLALLAAFGSLSSPSHSTANVDQCNQYLDNGNFGAYEQQCQDVVSSNNSFSDVTNNIGDQGIIYLAGAALFLGSTWVLDRRGYRGTATAFCGAGLVAALVGSALFVNNLNSDTGPVLVTAVGVLVCVVGAHGARRATTWWGAAMIVIGTTSFILIQWNPSGSTSGGMALLLAGALLVAAPLIGGAIRRGTQQNVPPPTTE